MLSDQNQDSDQALNYPRPNLGSSIGTNINAGQGSAPPPSWSEVQSVKLSRSSCIISVESLYESSATLSSSAIASSKAVRAILHASSGLPSTSYWKTEKFNAKPRRIGCVTA